MDKRVFIGLGTAVAVIGLLLLVTAILLYCDSSSDAGDRSGKAGFLITLLVVGAVFLLLGVYLAIGLTPRRFAVGPKGGEVVFDETDRGFHRAPAQPPRRRQLSPEVEKERQLLEPDLPGAQPGDFKLFEAPEYASLNISHTSTMPAYTLDKAFRIVDWNKAFSLAFDFTMEGFRGQTVAQWVFLLENYKEVSEQGIKAFKDKTEDEYPNVHVEELVFKSDVYGRVSATKRAYKTYDDQQQYVGWIVTVNPEFESEDIKSRFDLDLLATLRDDLMWSEYALSYDVLNKTEVYQELLRMILGETGPLSPIPPKAHVLDLGAGTGNVSAKLMGDERTVFAIENNPMMLQMLKGKCAAQLRFDSETPGVIPVRQDISSLFGIPTGYFHYAVLNNVLYSIDDPLPCLKATYDCLCPGGEVRVSGPHLQTEVEPLLDRIKDELEHGPGLTGKIKDDYEKVDYINRFFLKPRLRRWSPDKLQEIIKNAGFSEITQVIDDAYAGQAMIISAKK